MKRSRNFRLLSKTTFIYLIFTFIAFFSSAVFLNREANDFIKNNLDNRFQKTEYRLQHHIKAGKSLEMLPASVRITPIGKPASMSRYPVYTDTLIHNSELDEMHRYRRKTTVFEVNDQYYQAEMIKSIEHFVRLQDDIFEALFPAFILLAAGIVLFNYLLAGYFFRPFNKILGLMRTYQVGQRSDIKKIKTNTVEFQRMQDLFHQMIERIEYDYRHLKEYTENMAHEMRTPLSVIRNKIENLIADELVMQHHADNVRIIYNEANYLSKLSNTLNLLTKIENGEFSNTIQIQTHPVIRKHIAAVSELADLKSLTIETELSEEHQLVIDPFLLDIILKNLLRNAISYGQPKGPVWVKTTKASLSVSNFGPPLEIPPEKLFERFYRGNSRISSLGLGLSLLKKSVN